MSKYEVVISKFKIVVQASCLKFNIFNIATQFLAKNTNPGPGPGQNWSIPVTDFFKIPAVKIPSR